MGLYTEGLIFEGGGYIRTLMIWWAYTRGGGGVYREGYSFTSEWKNIPAGVQTRDQTCSMAFCVND